MKKEDIIRALEKQDSTVLSFPDRGPWGDKKYRGNCSGYIQASLIWKYGIRKMAELFAGSGTGYDVAKDMGIDYVGADLNPTPARPGILQVDAFQDDVPDAFYGADLTFMHPPYGKEIGIPYAGSMYPDPTGELSKRDLGQMEWKSFMKALNAVVMKYFAAMEPGSYMGILMGDVRRNGICHSMLTDIVKPGQLEQIIIKMQHNTMSQGRTYAKRNFYPLVHEYVLVLKKIADFLISFQLPRDYEVDIRDSRTATWKDIVASVLYKNRELPMEAIYRSIDGHARTKTNKHWQEKVRQTLYIHSCFVSSKRGYWSIAA